VEVVLGVDEGSELVGKVLVVGVHFHRSMLVGSANAFLPFKSDDQLTFTPDPNKQPNISGNLALIM
jgi:hypothetical protein